MESSIGMKMVTAITSIIYLADPIVFSDFSGAVEIDVRLSRCVQLIHFVLYMKDTFYRQNHKNENRRLILLIMIL